MRHAANTALLNGVAPGEEDFRAAHKHFLAGGTLQLPDVGGREKVTRMLFCLAEAQRECERAALKKARTIAVAKDVSQNALALTFTACDETTFSVTRGFFGRMHLPADEVPGAPALRKSSEVLIM